MWLLQFQNNQKLINKRKTPKKLSMYLTKQLKKLRIFKKKKLIINQMMKLNLLESLQNLFLNVMLIKMSNLMIALERSLKRKPMMKKRLKKLRKLTKQMIQQVLVTQLWIWWLMFRKNLITLTKEKVKVKNQRKAKLNKLPRN